MMRKFKFLFVVALLTAPFAFSGEFDDFEKSLMQNSEPSGSTDSTSSASSMDAFEQSLISESGTEMENIYQLREALLEAAKRGDTAQVSRGIEELEALKTEDMVPLVDVESQVLLIRQKMWPQLLQYEVKRYKNFYNDLVNEKARYAENDGLMLYIKKEISKFDTTSALLMQLESDIDKSSSLSESEKLELKILLLLNDAYRDDKVNERIARLSQMFLEKYPDHPDAKWIENSVAGPYFRRDFWDLWNKDRQEHREENIARNFYTGGLGFNLYFLSGGLAFGMDELYRSDLFEPEPPGIYLELYLQIKRFAISFELLPSGIEGVATYSLGLGFVAYDSRYLKVRPYIGLGMPAMILDAKQDGYLAMPGGDREYFQEGNNEMYAESFGFTLAANVDFKFLTTYLFSSSSNFFSMMLTGKFGITYMEFDDTIVKGSGATPFFALGFGLLLW
jgi:hypothetical protein